MKYWYKLSDKERYIESYIGGYEALPVKLYPETEEIVKDFEENELSDWWGVTRFNQRNFAEFTDFATREEAEKEFAAQLGNDIYCKMHDC